MKTTRRAAAAAAVAAWLAGCAAAPEPITMRAPPPGASAASVQAHVDAATRAAGTDLTPLLALCKPAPAARAGSGEDRDATNSMIARLIAQPVPPPGQAFDNLYFVGAKWSSAWALKTSQGLILIDALNNDMEAETVIDAGLRKLGLNPAELKYIIVSHGHGDHYGGVNWLVKRYPARVVMSPADWTMTETRLEFASPLWGGVPKRDIALGDGDTLTLGDTSVRLYLTPGHTLGTLSTVFDVTGAPGGRKHRVLIWGGTSFNFGKDFERMDAYIAATERMRRLAAEQNIDVMLSNHSSFDQSLEKLQQLRAAAPGAPNPFVIGTEAVQRSLTVMGECARAQRDRFSLM